MREIQKGMLLILAYLIAAEALLIQLEHMFLYQQIYKTMSIESFCILSAHARKNTHVTQCWGCVYIYTVALS